MISFGASPRRTITPQKQQLRSHNLNLNTLEGSLSYSNIRAKASTYDHRLLGTGHPVRSAIHKQEIGRLVVGWVTTSEYLLLYVF
ncbi:hypothetical protein DL95DRAFT_283697 [Leptodontidium sp. 2 PMI_412]|nr:hypothetical protein DL95DRAFT_283697 [Leptodontidium sp. 2 PMI_412]